MLNYDLQLKVLLSNRMFSICHHIENRCYMYLAMDESIGMNNREYIVYIIIV